MSVMPLLIIFIYICAVLQRNFALKGKRHDTADSVSTTGSTSGSQKRKRAESIVTKQQQPLAKKATSVPRTAGWLLGRIENSAERGYRGSAMGHGGWSRGRGGRFGGPVGYDRAGRA
jgi:hypothetical protein